MAFHPLPNANAKLLTGLEFVPSRPRSNLNPRISSFCVSQPAELPGIRVFLGSRPALPIRPPLSLPSQEGLGFGWLLGFCEVTGCGKSYNGGPVKLLPKVFGQICGSQAGDAVVFQACGVGAPAVADEASSIAGPGSFWARRERRSGNLSPQTVLGETQNPPTDLFWSFKIVLVKAQNPLKNAIDPSRP